MVGASVAPFQRGGPRTRSIGSPGLRPGGLRRSRGSGPGRRTRGRAAGMSGSPPQDGQVGGLESGSGDSVTSSRKSSICSSTIPPRSWAVEQPHQLRVAEQGRQRPLAPPRGVRPGDHQDRRGDLDTAPICGQADQVFGESEDRVGAIEHGPVPGRPSGMARAARRERRAWRSCRSCKCSFWFLARGLRRPSSSYSRIDSRTDPGRRAGPAPPPALPRRRPTSAPRPPPPNRGRLRSRWRGPVRAASRGRVSGADARPCSRTLRAR